MNLLQRILHRPSRLIEGGFLLLFCAVAIPIVTALVFFGLMCAALYFVYDVCTK